MDIFQNTVRKRPTLPDQASPKAVAAVNKGVPTVPPPLPPAEGSVSTAAGVTGGPSVPPMYPPVGSTPNAPGFGSGPSAITGPIQRAPVAPIAPVAPPMAPPVTGPLGGLSMYLGGNAKIKPPQIPEPVPPRYGR